MASVRELYEVNQKFMKQYSVPYNVMAKSEDIFDLVNMDSEKIDWEKVLEALREWKPMLKTGRMKEFCDEYIDDIECGKLHHKDLQEFCMIMFSDISKEYKGMPGKFGKRRRK